MHVALLAAHMYVYMVDTKAGLPIYIRTYLDRIQFCELRLFCVHFSALPPPPLFMIIFVQQQRLHTGMYGCESCKLRKLRCISETWHI